MTYTGRVVPFNGAATGMTGTLHMADGAVDDAVRRALRDGPFAMRQLAADSGLSYDVLRSWRSGRRKPNAESIRKLADGMARRADILRDLARDLRRQT